MSKPVSAGYVWPPVPVHDILERLRRVEQDLETNLRADPSTRAYADALDKVRGAIADVEPLAEAAP